jgi:hypothetical protein
MKVNRKKSVYTDSTTHSPSPCLSLHKYPIFKQQKL